MDVNEAAALLAVAPESVKAAIEQGVQLPKSGTLARLEASSGPDGYEISDRQFDAWISAFEAEQPGRKPPVAVRRELRVESRHKCGICRADMPLFFHHIIPWRKLKQHDPEHMLAVCGGCHSKIETGQIDRPEQSRYKVLLQDAREAREYPSSILPGPGAPVAWSDLSALIGLCHELIRDEPTASSQFDFSSLELEQKNELNKLSSTLYQVMRENDEPFFRRIQEFLENPQNAPSTVHYHEVVDELRRRVASAAGRFATFDEIIHQLHSDLLARFQDRLHGKRRALRILISFMYFNCDIGRKR